MDDEWGACSSTQGWLESLLERDDATVDGEEQDAVLSCVLAMPAEDLLPFHQPTDAADADAGGDKFENEFEPLETIEAAAPAAPRAANHSSQAKVRSHASPGNQICFCCKQAFVAIDGRYEHYNLACHFAAARCLMLKREGEHWEGQQPCGTKKGGKPKYSVMKEQDRIQTHPDGTIVHVLPGLRWQSRLCEQCRPSEDPVLWGSALMVPPPPVAAPAVEMPAMPIAAVPPPMAAQTAQAGAMPTAPVPAGTSAAQAMALPPAGSATAVLVAERSAAMPRVATTVAAQMAPAGMPNVPVPTEFSATALATPMAPIPMALTVVPLPAAALPTATAMPIAALPISKQATQEMVATGLTGQPTLLTHGSSSCPRPCHAISGGHCSTAQSQPHHSRPLPMPSQSPVRPLHMSSELLEPQCAQASPPPRTLPPGRPSEKGFLSGLPLTHRADLIPRGDETESQVLNCFGMVILPGRRHVLPEDARTQLWAAKPSDAEPIENGGDRLRLHWPKDRQAGTAWKARAAALGILNAELSMVGLSQCERLGFYAGQHRVAVDARGLLRLRGCKEQPAHADARADILRYFETPSGNGGTAQIVSADMPLTGYFTPEQHSRLPCFPQGCGGGRVELDLEQDDLSVFRGDFVHAGPGFPASSDGESGGESSGRDGAPIVHRAVHFYIDAPAWKRRPNGVSLCPVAADAPTAVPLRSTAATDNAATVTDAPSRKRQREAPSAAADVAAAVPATAVAAPAASSVRPANTPASPARPANATASPANRHYQKVRPRQPRQSPKPLPPASPVCNIGHGMEGIAATDGQKCDDCGFVFAADELCWRCTGGCDFDLCETCGDARIRNGDPAYMPPPRGSLRLSRASPGLVHVPGPAGSQRRSDRVDQRPQSPTHA